MDRSYKGEDLVHVYQDSREGPLLATFRQAPYTMHGFDNYIYQGVAYKGYIDQSQGTMRTYILLTHPLL